MVAHLLAAVEDQVILQPLFVDHLQYLRARASLMMMTCGEEMVEVPQQLLQQLRHHLPNHPPAV
jgi:uncharacterized linocin/CFP29 family protein